MRKIPPSEWKTKNQSKQTKKNVINCIYFFLKHTQIKWIILIEINSNLNWKVVQFLSSSSLILSYGIIKKIYIKNHRTKRNEKLNNNTVLMTVNVSVIYYMTLLAYLIVVRPFNCSLVPPHPSTCLFFLEKKNANWWWKI